MGWDAQQPPTTVRAGTCSVPSPTCRYSGHPVVEWGKSWAQPFSSDLCVSVSLSDLSRAVPTPVHTGCSRAWGVLWGMLGMPGGVCVLLAKWCSFGGLPSKKKKFLLLSGHPSNNWPNAIVQVLTHTVLIHLTGDFWRQQPCDTVHHTHTHTEKASCALKHVNKCQA